MCRLDIVWVVIPPSAAHAFGVSMIGDDVVVMGELFVTDCTFSVLLDDLPVQELAHLGRGSEFAVSPRMMWVLDALHSQPHYSGLVFLSYCFSATTIQGSMYGTTFVATKPHDTTPEPKNEFLEMRRFLKRSEEEIF